MCRNICGESMRQICRKHTIFGRDIKRDRGTAKNESGAMDHCNLGQNKERWKQGEIQVHNGIEF